MSTSAPTLSLEHVTFRYDTRRPIFADLSLTLGGPATDGFVVAVMGPSGSGKTTLLRLLAGLLEPQEGSRSRNPANSPIVYLSQDPILFDHLNAADNARYYRSVRKLRRYYSEEEYLANAKRLQLSDVMARRQPVGTLSGGERQRVALLRALTVQPRFVLLDEPCMGLDVAVRIQYVQALRAALAASNALALYVTHSGWEANLVADRLLYLSPTGPAQPVACRDIDLRSTDTIAAMPDLLQTLSSSVVNRWHGIRDGNLVALGDNVSLPIPAWSFRSSQTEGELVFAADDARVTSEGDVLLTRYAQSAAYAFYINHPTGYTCILKRENGAPPTGALALSDRASFVPSLKPSSTDTVPSAPRGSQ